MSETITFQGSTYTLLFPDLMRQLTPEEHADLGDAIRRKGRVIKPIVTDGQAGIIDGIHRLRWAVELGLPKKAVPFDPAGMGLTHEEQERLCRDLNDTGRQDVFEVRKANRQKRIERVAAARLEGQSTRTIAAAEGVSEKQVREDIKAATAEGYAVDPPNGKVKGADGKERDATAPPKAKGPCRKKRAHSYESLDEESRTILGDHPTTFLEGVMKSLLYTTDRQERLEAAKRLAESDATTVKEGLAAIAPPHREPGDDTEIEAVGEAEPSVPVDVLGHPLPANLVDAFAALERFKALDSLLRQMQQGIDELVRLPGGEQLARCTRPVGDEQKIIRKTEELQALRRHLRSTRPHAVCPWCKGKAPQGCKGCSGRGWVAKVTWDAAEDSVKEALG
jgi:hypothetical protein